MIELALISSEAIVSAIIWLICLGVVFWLLFWLVGYCALPEPFNKVARILLAIAAVVVLINVIMTIGGHRLF